MEKDKAFLPIGNVPLYQFQVSRFKQLEFPIYLSTNKHQKFETDLPIIIDQYNEIGPMGGIYSLLQNDSKAKWIVIPVDMVRVSMNFIHRLIEADTIHQNRSIFSKVEDFIQPFPCLIHPNSITQLKTLIETNQYKMMDLIEDTSSVVIQVNNYAKDFLNLNDMKGFKEFVDIYGS